MNKLGQLLYLDYEIKDLKKRNYSDSLSKASKKKQVLIQVIQEIDNPTLQRSLKRYYIDSEVNEFIENNMKKMRSRHLSKISYCNLQDLKDSEIAKKRLHMVLNHQIILTNAELEKVISNLDNSLDRIIFRKFLFDKKNYAQIAKDINSNTFRRASSTSNKKSTFNRSTVSRRINKFK